MEPNTYKEMKLTSIGLNNYMGPKFNEQMK